MPNTTSKETVCESRVFALVWRALTLAACCWGLYPMFFGGAPFTGHSLCYFTTQSNLLIAALFAVLLVGTLLQLIKSGPHGEAFGIRPWLQLGIVFFIQITFLVFAFVLSGTLFSMGSGIGFSNFLLHYAVPLMALADWALFMPHGRVSFRHAAFWLAYPAAYVVFSFIRAGLGQPFFDGSRFPYFFMDADVLGWNLLWICPLFFAGFFALGCLIVAADKWIASLLNRKTKQEDGK